MEQRTHRLFLDSERLDWRPYKRLALIGLVLSLCVLIVASIGYEIVMRPMLVMAMPRLTPKVVDVAHLVAPMRSNASLSGATAGGDLSGTYPNPTVTQINGAVVMHQLTSGTITSSTAQSLLRNATAGYGGTGITTPQTNGVCTSTVSMAVSTATAGSCSTSTTLGWSSTR